MSVQVESEEMYQVAKRILDEGGAVAVTRFTSGKLRSYFRSRRGETRRVYQVNEHGFRNSPTVVIELREKEGITK